MESSNIKSFSNQIKLVCFVVVLAFSFVTPSAIAAQAPDKHSIVWYHPDFPPANFVDSLLEGLGYADQIQKYLTQRLPQYHHYSVSASYQRIFHNIRYDQGCTIGLYKNKQRNEFLTYSMPMLLTFPNGVVVRAQDNAHFKRFINQDGYLNFSPLVHNKSLIFGVADGRSYSKVIDQFIQQNRNETNMMIRSGEDVFGALLKMLDRKRVDYILGFPEELAYHLSLGVLQNEMKFYPIAELTKYEFSYIACSKNAWGDQVIQDINHILQKDRLSPEFLRFFEFWLDFDSKKRHQQLSHQIFSAPENSKN